MTLKKILDLFKGEYLGHRLHFQDETRLGLMTKCGRKLTAKGVKPIGIKASDYRNYYIYGTVEPESGGFLMYEFDKINSENFQEFLNAFELAYPEGEHVIVVDGSRTHFAKKLEIPPRIKLLQLPPYCPELNPIERVWQHLKRHLNWKNWPTLDQLKDEVMTVIDSWDELDIFSLTAYPYIRETLNVTL